MKTLLKLILLICGSWICCYYMDWRFALIFPFFLTLIRPHHYLISELIIGFSGIFLVWLTAAFIIDGGNNSVLSSRLAQLFGLPDGPAFVIITGVLGGIFGATGAMTGYYLRKSFPLRTGKI